MHLSTLRLRAGQVADSLEEFCDVAAVAGQNGICRLILDEGRELEALLTEFHHASQIKAKYRELMPYVRSLADLRRADDGSPAAASAEFTVAETLTQRENAILKLIAEGLSNKAMARELVIAPDTVKSHVKNIFTKLGVEKRAQAVSRAQSLGLLHTG
jgi:LuxR family maltose regulon positive regulatory protein